MEKEQALYPSHRKRWGSPVSPTYSACKSELQSNANRTSRKPPRRMLRWNGIGAEREGAAASGFARVP